MKDLAGDNFKFDENGRKVTKWVENTCYKQFLLFPQCFQKTSIADKNQGLFWKGLTMMK